MKYFLHAIACRIQRFLGTSKGTCMGTGARTSASAGTCIDTCLFTAILLFSSAIGVHAQQSAQQSAAQSPTSQPAHRPDYSGLYIPAIDKNTQFRIKKNGDQWILELVGQGEAPLTHLSGDSFSIPQISPPANVTFVPLTESAGWNLLWSQGKKSETHFVRTQPSSASSNPFSVYTGEYKIKGNAYLTIRITADTAGLLVQKNDGDPWLFKSIGQDQFLFRNGDFSIRYRFTGKGGGIGDFYALEAGPLLCRRTISPLPDSLQEHAFNQRDHFTRADTIRGMLTPLRTCYDVLFYGLDLAIDPSTKSIRGRTELRFRAMSDFDSCQIDCYASIGIDSILYRGKRLDFRREHNAVYLRMPRTERKNEVDTLRFYIAGRPQEPNINESRGGFIWWQDRNGNPWIESVCQGSGASLWWPCKDHLSDKPDSMAISITVPSGLMDISNGRLLHTSSLPGGRARFDWYVDYPINNYNVVVNIGRYKQYSETILRDNGDSLPIHYYYVTEEEARAKKVFRDLKPMLAAYEKAFGFYPFARDGVTVLESLYPMEHQGAVSIGSIHNPVNSDHWDSLDLQHTLFHEMAHEWWGNSVTCRDMADFWIHESFATYSELLAYAAVSGPAAARRALESQHPDNKEPIIGFYDVNDFHMGDMYPKGCLMLNTLRHVIDNDSLWFALLRGIQRDFRYAAVGTGDIVNYINRFCNTNLTPFFDQYLRHPAIPVLVLEYKKAGEGMTLRYKWKADVSGFTMPARLATSALQEFIVIHPTTSWQELPLHGIQPRDLRVDTNDFYIGVENNWPVE